MLIGVIGYCAAFAGLFTGAAIAVTRSANSRSQTLLMGFSAGVLIAFVCFEMLPAVFQRHGIYIGIAGIILGTLASAWVEERTGDNSAVFTAGILLHGFPEGIALGNMLARDLTAGLYMAAVIAIHCVPEALALSGYLRRRGHSRIRILADTMLLSAPVGAGAALGGALGDTLFSSACLAFAGGIMIYITCGEILPETGQRHLGAVTAGLGFAAGVLLTGL